MLMLVETANLYADVEIAKFYVLMLFEKASFRKLELDCYLEKYEPLFCF